MIDTMKLFMTPLHENHHKNSNAVSQRSTTTIPRFTILYALRKGYFNLIRHLLRNGDSPNQVDEKDKNKRTPLIYCTFIKDDRWALSIAQNLLEYGANLEKSDKRALNALHYCCAFNKYRLLELFLNSLDFDLLEKVDLNGNTCLHYATKYRHLKCVRLILNKCKQYNLKTLEQENLYGYKPTDMLNINANNYNKELDDKCRLIIKNYDRNLLANRKSFDNIANRMPLAHLENIANQALATKDRPITAPTKGPKPLNESSPLSLNNTTGENKCCNGSMAVDNDDSNPHNKKHKISFLVIPPSPSASTKNTPPNSVNNSMTTYRPYSTQSHKFFKLNSKYDNEPECSEEVTAVTNTTQSQAPVTAPKSATPKVKKPSVTFERKMSASAAGNTANSDAQLLVDLNELSQNSISYSDLCSDKEHIVNPNGRMSDVVVVNAHRHRYNSTKIREDTNLMQINHTQLVRTLSAARQRSFLRTEPPQLLNHTIAKTNGIGASSPKLTRSPTNLGLTSGRQSRQSFVAGYLVQSQSDVYDQMTINDSDDLASGFYMNHPYPGHKNIADPKTLQQQQIELNYENLVGWRKSMRSIINELEYKESTSYRKTIHPPVNVQCHNASTPTIDLNSSELSDRSKIGSTKKDKRSKGTASALGGRIHSAVSNAGSHKKSTKH